ncbi:hypothetical protein GCM10010411_58380 [Actinomadura fulvescens]|uniref:Uncharacterized protein n=2 Tax=Actinomadura fulvescens TaxID=46160 RepID=A0ABP6CJW0_9ACTN
MVVGGFTLAVGLVIALASAKKCSTTDTSCPLKREASRNFALSTTIAGTGVLVAGSVISLGPSIQRAGQAAPAPVAMHTAAAGGPWPGTQAQAAPPVQPGYPYQPQQSGPQQQPPQHSGPQQQAQHPGQQQHSGPQQPPQSPGQPPS